MYPLPFVLTVLLLAGQSLAAIKIMALGDSITGSPGCWRALLYRKLQTAGLTTNTDFVGTLQPDGCGFTYDGQHEGHASMFATNIASQNLLTGWLAATKPDVVMMHLGTNDVWSAKSPTELLGAYATLVKQMRASNSRMKILVAQIIPLNPRETSPCAECPQRVVALDQAIPQWAAGLNSTESPITVVDCYTGFNPATDTGDGVHPNEAGNEKLADAWFAPLASVIRTFGEGS
ncbi:SGNH hydrolase [Eremomyces bilateralis CBS 781.70]|uniref:SGNH hydrolase n=1 Tax=Eremomyces bilateralis CBS 781.70 TaxID=1392243 RepID=A0A6G1G6X5_9PEZI|nr:SGNH hydrolase [Eremomyces bilateralis CBS 781.70]KAF1813579.1 SGNH hydrolase [Eremomyces bilateralis CBS 781.70]